MYDDYDDDDGEIGLDQEAVAYETKGKEDRAFVDQQSKEYDEQKKRQRDEITKLKNTRLAAQSKLAHKERELAALELVLRKDDYLETRERVKSEHENAMHEESFTREEKADVEVEEISRVSDKQAREAEHEALKKECATLKENVDEISRQISLLEYALIRS